jgi:hypothetical protein
MSSWVHFFIFWLKIFAEFRSRQNDEKTTKGEAVRKKKNQVQKIERKRLLKFKQLLQLKFSVTPQINHKIQLPIMLLQPLKFQTQQLKKPQLQL